MGLLKKAVNEQAYLKAGIFGNAGSGKTTTSSHLAMAIAHKIGKSRPVAFFETEAGSDFLVGRYEQEGIELLRVKSHSLADLISVAKEAEEQCSCLIVDSITHVWNNVCDSKLKAINNGRKTKAERENRKFYPLDKLEFQHWADVKRQWAIWTSAFLNSRLHIIVCGRAGGTYEFETNEETGKKELQKTGTKMKAEGEFGYEPSLLLEMERIQKGADVGSGWLHRVHVLKDRTDCINGKAFTFEKPRSEYKKGDWEQTFKPFKSVFDHLNIGGVHVTYDATRSSVEMFPGTDGDSQRDMRAKRVAIALEEVEGSITLLWPGQDKDTKQIKQVVLQTLWCTKSWIAVQSLPLEQIEAGMRILQALEDSQAELTTADSVIAAIESLKNTPEASNNVAA